MSETERREHWLVTVARAAGLPGAGELHLDVHTSVGEAWHRVEEACGIDPDALAREVARHFRLEVADLNAVEKKAVKLLPESVARDFWVLPLRETYRRLIIASSDPTDVDAEKAVEFASGRAVGLEVAPPGELRSAVLAHYAPDRAVAEILEQVGEDVEETVRLVEDEEEEVPPSLEVVASGPVVHLTNVILKEAITRRASDVHLQPTPHGGLIRLRIDGVLRTTGTMPLAILTRVVSRIKIMAKLDIADHLRPQDGRARVSYGGKTMDLRISTVPTRHGEKAVIRILDPRQVKSLDEIAACRVIW